MSAHRPAARALAVALIVPVAALLACTHQNGPREVPPPAAGDSSGGQMDALFAGKFPGVIVRPQAGGGVQILMRGGPASFNASTEPLYVLDETPLPGGTGGIVTVNPYDIQKIEVLKNPADIAIYGMRGSNGVIKITTKRPSDRVRH